MKEGTRMHISKEAFVRSYKKVLELMKTVFSKNDKKGFLEYFFPSWRQGNSG